MSLICQLDSGYVSEKVLTNAKLVYISSLELVLVRKRLGKANILALPELALDSEMHVGVSACALNVRSPHQHNVVNGLF
jgi:hypothetical protein